MTTDKASRAQWGTGVRISQPRLRRVDFDYEPDIALPQPLNIEFMLTMLRIDERELGVELVCSVVDVPGLTASVSYGIAFQLDPESPEGHEPDRAFKMICARMAPVTLYPFCREALTSIAQRAGLTQFVAPITNVGALWTPDEIDVPQVGDATEDDDVD
jgi:hypothetical protein